MLPPAWQLDAKTVRRLVRDGLPTGEHADETTWALWLLERRHLLPPTDDQARRIERERLTIDRLRLGNRAMERRHLAEATALMTKTLSAARDLLRQRLNGPALTDLHSQAQGPIAHVRHALVHQLLQLVDDAIAAATGGTTSPHPLPPAKPAKPATTAPRTRKPKETT